jgi:porphobilinogen synthase
MKRLQRLKTSAALRDMTAEIGFGVAQLVQPLFVVESLAAPEPVPGLGDNDRLPLAALGERVDGDLAAGVRQFMLFVVPAARQEHGFDPGFAGRAIAAIKARTGADATLWVDTCLCSHTRSGHCGLHDPRGRQDLPRTLAELAQLAHAYADAGADGVAPSDMNDGRCAHLRATLDAAGHDLLPIMSYSSKFASGFYGPFRVAADSTPRHGDRRGYQLDVRSARDAYAASERCAAEGADLLMVKPGVSSIDLIAGIAARTGLPVGAYQVSGEYAALTLLAREGLANFDAVLLESWQVMRRAGAAFIVTYGARHGRTLGLH